MTLEKLPLLSVDLINDLDKLYPHRCPKMGTPSERIWFDSGKRELIDFLLSRIQHPDAEQELPTVLVKD